MVAEQYPLLNHKPALMRAFKATLGAGNGDDWVQKNEFKMLLSNLFYFNKLFWLFDQDGVSFRGLFRAPAGFGFHMRRLMWVADFSRLWLVFSLTE